MKFKTTAKLLKSILSKMMNVVENNASLPILANIFIKLEENNLMMLTSDIENSIIFSTTVKGSSNGEICIPAQLFSNIINSFTNDITITLNDGTVCIKSEKSEFQIPNEDCDSFPRSFDTENMQSVVLTDKNVKNFAKVLHSAGNPKEDELKQELLAIFLTMQDEDIKFVATNGYKLTEVRDILTTGQKSPLISLLLNQKVSRLIAKYGSEKDKSLELSYNEKYAQVTLGDLILISKLVTDVTFPNYTAVIPTTFNTEFSVKKDIFRTAVKRASYINNKVVEFSFNEKTLTITGNNPDNNMHYSQNVEYKAPEETTAKDKLVDFKINSEFLLDAITETDPEKEEITIKIAQKNILICGKSGHIELIMFKSKPEKKKETKEEKDAKKKEETTTTTETTPKDTKKTKKAKTTEEIKKAA